MESRCIELMGRMVAKSSPRCRTSEGHHKRRLHKLNRNVLVTPRRLIVDHMIWSTCFEVHGTNKKPLEYGKGRWLADLFNHLRKWRSNSNTVLVSIPEEDRAPDAMVALQPDKLGLTSRAVKTLGVSGSVRDDNSTFSYHPPERLLQVKRTVLAKRASMLKPSGQISPITIRARNMFQDFCLLGLDWND